jgi:hypothetical protein
MKNCFLLHFYAEQHRFHAWGADEAVPFGPEIGLLEGKFLPEDAGKHLIITLSGLGPESVWPDFWELGGVDILVSSKMRDKLLSVAEGPDYYQFISPRYSEKSIVPKEMDYKLLNVIDHLDCLDKDHSRFGSDGVLLEPVLRHDAVDGLMHLFRIRGQRTEIGLSRQLAESLNMSDLTGIWLSEVDLSFKQGDPNYEQWIAARVQKNADHEQLKKERQKRLLIKKPDGKEFQPGEQYPVKPPQEGPFREEPKSRVIPH